MKKSNVLLGTLVGLGMASVAAQELSVDAMIRPRFEYRHGSIDVAPEDTDGAAFVSQRSALLFKYTDAKITTFLDLQSTSVWGDRSQLNTDDGSANNRGFRVNQGWAEISLGSGWSTKAGRMILSYDDQRIIGGLGWAQQQRTHDAALLRYKTGTLKADLGFSFNSNTEDIFGNVFQPSAPAQPVFQYKGMQYLHLNNKFSDVFSGSFLFINNQFQNLDGDGVAMEDTSSRQTTGIYGKYKSGALGFDFSGYYQFGEFVDDIDISAYQVMANVTYKPGATLFGAGFEILSGNDTDSAEQEAFFPLYGTNHKFNGFQDFFYVGRHANNGGLLDLNGKIVFKTGEKSTLLAKGHIFSGMTDQAAYDAGYYGTSVDLVFTQKINAYAKLNIGYSHSILDDDFANARASRNSDVALEADSIQNWGWVMLTVNPNLFKWKKPAPAAE